MKMNLGLQLATAVSYTHLDVYKRQVFYIFNLIDCNIADVYEGNDLVLLFAKQNEGGINERT